MTESNRAVDVNSLVEERQRYVSWLEALEAKRDATPAHIYTRVHDDYRERLRRVEGQLAAQRRSMEEERSGMQSRLDLIEAEEQMRADERAELELRRHVGEVGGGDADEALKSLEHTLAKLSSERRSLQEKLEALDTLVKATPAVSEPGVESSAPEASPAEAVPVEVRGELRGEPRVEPRVEPQAAAPESEHGAAAVARAGVEPTDEGRRTPGGRFDELAFLTSIVGQPEAAPRKPPEPPVAPAKSRDIEMPASEQLIAASHARPSDAEPPLAANVASNTPIVLRSTAGSEQAKSLKCNECGAMNYPTEWYCERCGAELAAL